jgi:hypothetical protein
MSVVDVNEEYILFYVRHISSSHHQTFLEKNNEVRFKLRVHYDSYWTNKHKHSSPSKCINSTTQHTRKNTNTHVLSGIRAHDLSVQAAKTLAPDRAAIVITPWAMTWPKELEKEVS